MMAARRGHGGPNSIDGGQGVSFADWVSANWRGRSDGWMAGSAGWLPPSGRYHIPKELLSSAPFRCLPSRQGKLKTQNQKPNRNKKPRPIPTPLELQERQQKRREYEQKRNQQPERQQSARDQQRKLRQKAKELGICCACSQQPRPGPAARGSNPVQLADMAHRKLHRNVPRVDGALTVPPQGASCPAGCATRRRRQCSRRQPAPTQPGSQSCRRCWLDPGHCLGRGAAEPVGAGRDGRPMWWEGSARH